MGIRQRKVEADYLKVGEKFEFLGTGFTGINEKPNAQTAEKRYVNESSSSQAVTGYKWQSDFQADQIESEVAVEYIVDIGKELKVGSNCETEFVKVDLDKLGTGENSFYARKFKVAIKVDSFDDNNGELSVTGSFLGSGDPIIGEFNTTTKTFTEKA